MDVVVKSFAGRVCVVEVTAATAAESGTLSAQQAAVAAATEKIGKCGLSNTTGAYPVRKSGKLVETNLTPAELKADPVVGYRREYKCMASV